MTSSTRTAVDTGLWHQSDFITSGWASDIFLLLSFINYFLLKCFHTKIPQYFTLNTYTDFCCSPLQPIPHSGFFPSSRTTPHSLFFANSRVKSNFNNCSKTNNRSKPLTSPILMVLCSIQNTEEVTLHTQVGHETSSAAQRSMARGSSPHKAPSRICLLTLLSLINHPRPCQASLGVGYTPGQKIIGAKSHEEQLRVLSLEKMRLM